MVSVSVIAGLVIAVLALSQLPRITAFGKDIFGGGDGTTTTSTTTVIEEGDVVIIQEDESFPNTSDGKPSPTGTADTQTTEEVSISRVTDLDIAREEQTFFEQPRTSDPDQDVVITSVFNPIFFETLRKLDREERILQETQLEEAIPQELKFSTSIERAQLSTGEQLSRTDPDFQATLDAEAERSRLLFERLFGSVS